MQCPRCQHENPQRAKFCLECGTPSKGTDKSGPPLPSYADLQHALSETLGQIQTRDRELVEAHEQQTATAEILRVISSSPTDVQPVFDTIAQSAARLCEASDASLFERDRDHLRLVAHHAPIPIQPVLPLIRGTSNGRAILDRCTVHTPDMQRETEEFPEGSENARLMGHRTILSVPLLEKDGLAIGTINIRRAEARLFTEGQVALLETFAAQAVIAIENVRLFTELEARNRDLSEALGQQTATSEVLKVISQSTFVLQPLLDAVAKNAARVCEAEDIGVFRIDGDVLRADARYGAGPEQDIGSIARIGRDLLLGRTFLERRTIHVHDMAAELDREYPGMRGTVERFGMHTMCARRC
jgi:two-component system, NtrC family, sensor kinase